MKHFVRYLQIIPATLLVVACANQKEPVADLESLRKEAAESEARAKNPAPLPTPTTEYVVKTETKIKEVEKKVYVDKPVEVTKLVDRVSSDFLVITPPSRVTFTEGSSKSFNFKVRCNIPDCTPALTASDLPEGATFKQEKTSEASTAVYSMTWTPKIGITDASTGLFGEQITLKATASVKDAAKNEAFKNFNTTQVVSYFATRAPIVFTKSKGDKGEDIEIVGLPAEVQEGANATFAVTARIAGVDPQSPTKPTLTRSDDISVETAGGPVEIGGAGYLRTQSPVYENGTWKFNVTFDTKKFVVPKTGTSDVARAGFGFQVCMSGVCSDVKTAKINIKFTRPTVATVGKK